MIDSGLGTAQDFKAWDWPAFNARPFASFQCGRTRRSLVICNAPHSSRFWMAPVAPMEAVYAGSSSHSQQFWTAPVALERSTVPQPQAAARIWAAGVGPRPASPTCHRPNQIARNWTAPAKSFAALPRREFQHQADPLLTVPTQPLRLHDFDFNLVFKIVKIHKFGVGRARNLGADLLDPFRFQSFSLPSYSADAQIEACDQVDRSPPLFLL